MVRAKCSLCGFEFTIPMDERADCPECGRDSVHFLDGILITKVLDSGRLLHFFYFEDEKPSVEVLEFAFADWQHSLFSSEWCPFDASRHRQGDPFVWYEDN